MIESFLERIPATEEAHFGVRPFWEKSTAMIELFIMSTDARHSTPSSPRLF